MPIEELTLTLRIPKSIADGLRAEATKLNIPLASLIADVIEDYVDTPDSEIFTDIREGLREASQGGGLPALDTIAMIRKKLGDESKR